MKPKTARFSEIGEWRRIGGTFERIKTQNHESNTASASARRAEISADEQENPKANEMGKPVSGRYSPKRHARRSGG
jgi:hypothetical protein